MEEALRARLAAVPAIVALTGDRISWFGRGRAGGTELTLFDVTPGEDWTHDGPMALVEARVQIDAWSVDPDDVLALSRAVRTEMQTEVTIEGWRFEPASLEAKASTDEGEQDGGDPLFRVRQDFLFFHEEA
jgi:hypothetical protein